MQDRSPTPPDQRPALPDFTPVPRKARYDGWTPERQLAFIEALADTASVAAAARRVNMSAEGAYALRRQGGADGFRAAWDAALALGVQSLTDIAIDRAINGVAVPLFWRGEQVGERRLFNDRLLMFVLKHQLPGLYGTPSLPGPPGRARKAAPDAGAENEEASGTTTRTEAESAAWFDKVMARYIAKLRSERYYRRSGEVVAADFALRQLTHIELILDIGGRSTQTVVALTTERAANGDTIERYASPLGRHLDQLRRDFWAADGEQPRPPVALPDYLPTVALTGGDTRKERRQARREAEHAMAVAQAKWEAASTEETWAAWLGMSVADADADDDDTGDAGAA